MLSALVADGLDLIANTKAAIVRLGLDEMIRFSKMLYPGTPVLIMTCGGSRVICLLFNRLALLLVITNWAVLILVKS